MRDNRSPLPQPGLPLAIVFSLVLASAHWIVGIGLTSVAAFYFVSFSQRLDNIGQFLSSFELFLSPLAAINILAVALAVPWFMYRSQTPRLLGWRGLAWQQWMWVLLTVLPLVVLTKELRNCAEEFVHLWELKSMRVFPTGDTTFEKFSPQGFLVAIMVGCVLTALREEIYYRGFLSRGLVARYGIVAGTLIASSLFGVMHLDLVQGTSAFFLGIGLQFVFLATRSLSAPIVVHALNNAFVLCWLQFGDAFPVSGLTPSTVGLHIPPWLLVTAALALLCLTILIVQTRTRWILPDGSQWSPGYVCAERPPRELGAQPVSTSANRWLVAVCVAVYTWMIVTGVAAHNAVGS